MEASIRPTAVKAPHGAKELSITWSDGRVSTYPHEILRGYCPCAGCQGHSGEIRFHAGRDLDIRELTSVGNYALGLTWADGHSSGIYTFSYLRRLGELLDEHGVDGVRELEVLPRDA